MWDINDYDKFIYHFTTAEKALLYILPNLRLKLSPYPNTNDPKENKSFAFDDLYKKVDDFKKAEVQRSFELVLKEYCKVICFSADYEEKGEGKPWYKCDLLHPNVWAHYGDAYKGICLIINKLAFKKKE